MGGKRRSGKIAEMPRRIHSLVKESQDQNLFLVGSKIEDMMLRSDPADRGAKTGGPASVRVGEQSVSDFPQPVGIAIRLPSAPLPVRICPDFRQIAGGRLRESQAARDCAFS
jgi:hypothetical protein